MHNHIVAAAAAAAAVAVARKWHVHTLNISRPCFHEVISEFLRSLANRTCTSRKIEKFKLQIEKNARYLVMS